MNAPTTNIAPKPIDPATLVRAPSVLLLGAPGSGKTYSIVTLLKAGLKVFVVITEPSGLDTLLDACEKEKVSIDNLHYKIIAPSRSGFEELTSLAKLLTSMDYESMSKMRPSNRADAQIHQLMSTMRNFTCERTGASFGPVDKLPADSAVVIDSMSGLSLMVWDATVGNKLTAHQGEWGVAMNYIDRFVNTCTSSFRGLFVLTAHFERELDETTQGTKLMVSTLGRKLAPKIPRFFSEVVLARQEGPNYFWDTSSPSIDLKHRALPLGSKLPPSFEPVVAAHRRRLELVARPKAS